MIKRRPVLIGSDNPRPWEEPLYTGRSNSSGARLLTLLRERVPEAPGLERFFRRNAADLTMGPRALGDDFGTVLLLGERARRWAGLPPILIHPIERDGRVFRQLPHPSGRCLWYNHPTHRLLASLLLEDLYRHG